MYIHLNKISILIFLISFTLIFIHPNTITLFTSSQNNTYHLDLWYSPDHYGATEPDLALSIKEQLEATGYFDVTLYNTTWSQYTSRFGTMPVFLLHWFYDYFEESNYIQQFVSTAGGKGIGTNYSNPDMDVYINTMLTGNPTERIQAIRDAQALMVYDPVVIPLVTRGSNFVAYQKNLQDVYLQPSDHIDLGSINKTGGTSAILGTTDSIGGFVGSSTDFSGCYSFGCSFALKQISHGLFDIDRQTSEVVPSLVQDWNVSTNGLTYVFNLKPNLHFTDGNPLTPDDAIWSLNRSVYLNETSGGPSFLLDGLNLSPHDSDGLPTNHTVDMQIINSTAFSVKLRNKDSTFINRLTYTNAFIFEKNTSVSEGAGDQRAYSDYQYIPVGSGPFYISDYDLAGQNLVFSRYNSYDAGSSSGNITTFTIQKLVNSTALYASMEAKTIDIGYHSFSTSDIIDLESNSNIIYQKNPSLGIRYMVINIDSHPNRIIRQAITYALDRQQLVDKIFPTSYSLYSMVPPAFPGACQVDDTNSTLPCHYPEKSLIKVQELMQSQGYFGNPSSSMTTTQTVSTTTTQTVSTTTTQIVSTTTTQTVSTTTTQTVSTTTSNNETTTSFTNISKVTSSPGFQIFSIFSLLTISIIITRIINKKRKY
ncbi:MAG: ABC transporter substrate-binding protein [Candidatus Thorarchaeota archaeon]